MHLVLSRSKKPQGPHRFVSWRALPFIVIASLILALIPAGVFTTAVLAAHEGEETAGFLPSDTDLYLTINLDPSSEQLAGFWRVLNNWRQDPNVQAKWDELVTDVAATSSIDIQDDVFTWLGPEIAIGMRNLDTTEGGSPELIILEVTMDKDASYLFARNKVLRL
ncbi:MAG: DUF3352 domain-containing protein, partial [Chloroflexi bacterium]|nr:DUF3352 domain-containing protein [Chloroflexota bacterium]